MVGSTSIKIHMKNSLGNMVVFWNNLRPFLPGGMVVPQDNLGPFLLGGMVATQENLNPFFLLRHGCLGKDSYSPRNKCVYNFV